VSPTEQRKGVRYYTVFHASQIDGIPPLERPERNHELEGRPDPRLDVLAQNLGVSVGRGGGRAFYRPSDDHIQMPALEDFHTATGHDTTFLHEMAHATGHESRMQRDLKHAFGSEKYAIEELRAEMSAAMTAASLGIGFDPESQNVEEGREVGNSAAYLASWLRALPEKQRKDIIVQAIKDAQNISEYLIERTPELAVAAPDQAIESPFIAREEPQLQAVESPVIERTEDGQELRVVFWGKVNDVADIARRGIGDSEETARVKVAGVLNLSAEDYDRMTANLMDDQMVLKNLGGTDREAGARYVVDVRAPERQRLLLDTQGYDYPRYVGIPEGDVERVLERGSFVVGPDRGHEQMNEMTPPEQEQAMPTADPAAIQEAPARELPAGAPAGQAVSTADPQPSQDGRLVSSVKARDGAWYNLSVQEKSGQLMGALQRRGPEGGLAESGGASPFQSVPSDTRKLAAKFQMASGEVIAARLSTGENGAVHVDLFARSGERWEKIHERPGRLRANEALQKIPEHREGKLIGQALGVDPRALNPLPAREAHQSPARSPEKQKQQGVSI